jgi:hypothetical protein
MPRANSTVLRSPWKGGAISRKVRSHPPASLDRLIGNPPWWWHFGFGFSDMHCRTTSTKQRLGAPTCADEWVLTLRDVLWLLSGFIFYNFLYFFFFSAFVLAYILWFNIPIHIPNLGGVFKLISWDFERRHGAARLTSYYWTSVVHLLYFSGIYYVYLIIQRVERALWIWTWNTELFPPSTVSPVKLLLFYY